MKLRIPVYKLEVDFANDKEVEEFKLLLSYAKSYCMDNKRYSDPVIRMSDELYSYIAKGQY